MVLSDVQPDSIGPDGRHTPKITKGGESKSRGVAGERGGGGAKRSIDKAGTHRLIKIYSFFPPHHPPWQGQEGGGENVISGLLLPGCFSAPQYVHPMCCVYFCISGVFIACVCASPQSKEG